MNPVLVPATMGATVAEQALARLSAAYALFWLVIAMMVGPGSAAFVGLSGRVSDAGSFMALYFVSAAAGSVVGGRLLGRLGSRATFTSANVMMAIGFTVAGLGVQVDRLGVFSVGVALLAVAAGTLILMRSVVAESFVAERRGRAVARLQATALAGAVVGPLALVASEPLGAALGRPPLDLVWYFAPPFLAVAAYLTWSAPETYGARARSTAAPAERSSLPSAAWTAGFVLASCQGAMVLLMGVTGTVMVVRGHGPAVLGLMIAAHFVGMFGLSTWVGRTADRVGRRPTILAGIGAMLASGLIVATSGTTVGFGVGLFGIGLGWSFAFIGSTVVLGDSVPSSAMGRVFGTADMASALAAMAASIAAGWAYSQGGEAALGAAAIALLLAPFAAVFMMRPVAAPAVPAAMDA